MLNQLQKELKQIFKEEPLSILGHGVYRVHIQSLQDYEWIRSEAISLMSAIFKEKYHQIFQPNEKGAALCKIIDPFATWMMLFMGQQKAILESMGIDQLFLCRYLIIPSNTETKQNGKGSHWFLMIYDTLENSMLTMDSSYQCVHENAKIMGERFQMMREIAGKQKKQFKVGWLENVVKQPNNYDCGIYTLGNIERILIQLMNGIGDQENLKQIDFRSLKTDNQFFRDLRMKYFSQSLMSARQAKEKLI